uniref:Neprilysin-11 n=1 Tax=Cacopsylla melanoneura TaxID=428564 RepID=A0A8D9BV62_9HEMI
MNRLQMDSNTGRPKYSSFRGQSSQSSNFWTHRSLLEKTLLSIIALLFVSFMVMLWNFVNVQQTVRKEANLYEALNPVSQGAGAASFVHHGKMFKRDTTHVAEANVAEANVAEATDVQDQTPDEVEDDPRAVAKKPPKNAYQQPKLCYSEGCIHTASKLLQSMNNTVNPCDDFYRFTCGRFLEETIIPDDKSGESSFSVISDQLETQLRTIIEEPVKESDIKPFKLAKNLYKVCMNKSQIEQQGLGHMKYVLKHLGGWPVLEGESWDEGSFSWKSSVYKFRRYGYSVDYFMDFSVGVNLKNSTERLIEFDQASLGLSREYLAKGLSEKIVKAYFEYMIDIAVIMGANKEIALRELTESLNFEIALANISLPLEERRNATKLYNPMKLYELQDKFPSIPWSEYINTILSPNAKLNQDETIIVAVPSYIHGLEKLLSTTPKRVMANYVLWRVMAASVSYLSEVVRSRQLAYSTAVSGVSEQQARWKECVGTASSSFSLAIGSLYVRKYFKEEAKSNAVEMVQLIREEMYKILGTIDWMDEKTREAAIDKARSMSTHIAYPDELLDNGKLEEFYTGLELDTSNYLEAVLNLTKFGTNYSFSQLRKPVNKTDWKSHGNPAIVNAFYSSIENSIQFPAGILQGAFFSNSRPNYMNYGAIGFVIGHEITHGFDDQGRQFDKDGNLVDWWQEITKEKYLVKAQCIIEQYGNYSVPEVNLSLNGINTQGENIADNGGIKEAYNAYNVWVSRHGEEPRLPGLHQYSPRQMFWISAASVWCSLYRPESLKIRIRTGYHSPGEFRVLGPMSNLPQFAEDWKCPSGSKMNPTHKCEVW